MGAQAGARSAQKRSEPLRRARPTQDRERPRRMQPASSRHYAPNITIYSIYVVMAYLSFASHLASRAAAFALDYARVRSDVILHAWGLHRDRAGGLDMRCVWPQQSRGLAVLRILPAAIAGHSRCGIGWKGHLDGDE